MQDIDKLIIVAGHAIYTASDYSNQVDSASHWLLESYQTKQVHTYLSHIKRGLELASADERALLVFTGGFTRKAASAADLTEGQSYQHVARHHFTSLYMPIADRITSEITSRDSFENLLHAICRFRERVGRYPQRIVVIGFEFKRRRFEQLHAAAVRWPKDRFEYVGIDSDQWSVESLVLRHF